MKKWILSIVLGIASLIAVVSSDAVMKQVGITGQCDTANAGCTPIPLAVSMLCGPAAGCPTLVAPSYVDSNRFWGGGGSNCQTSTDGGQTWANCAVQPLSSGGQEVYAATSDFDPAVIAIGQVGATCTIRRSTDNAASWTTVYSNGALSGCGGGLSGGTRLKCLNDGRCEFVFINGGTSLPNVLASSDDGQTWALTANGAIATAAFISMAWDGTAGVVTSNGFRPEYYAAATWAQGVAYAACGTISGSMIYEGIGYGLCKDSGTNETYRMMDPVTGTLFKAITLPGALQTGSAPAYGYSIGNDILYIMAGRNTSPAIAEGIWVSRDDGVSFANIFTSSQALNGVTTRGDIFFHNGCIYHSILGSGGSMFLKICQ